MSRRDVLHVVSHDVGSEILEEDSGRVPAKCILQSVLNAAQTLWCRSDHEATVRFTVAIVSVNDEWTHVSK